FELSREPGRQVLCVFDNSTGHNAASPDALRAQKIALSAGGEQVPPHSFEFNGRTINTTFQLGDKLCFRSASVARKTEAEIMAKKRNGKKLEGIAKGMKQILEDMGLHKLEGESKPPNLECQRCLDEAKAKRDKSKMYNKGGENQQQALADNEDSDDPDAGSEGGARGADGTSRRCCCRRIISEVKAFQEQMNRVKELFEAAGHVCIFLAK
ncbi:unnamed protein product, partial [Ectocarpus sp. 4 AP-2014]